MRTSNNEIKQAIKSTHEKSKSSSFEDSMNHGSLTPKANINLMMTSSTQTHAKSSIKMLLLAKCKNPKCSYYLKRHRRFYWFTKSKLSKPSCPKCFSHNTEFVSSDEAKKLGI
jgi:hypothetical protein